MSKTEDNGREYNDQDIDNIIDTVSKDLIALGEDKDELEYWHSILNYIDLKQKYELAHSLVMEKTKILKVRSAGVIPTDEATVLHNLTIFLENGKRSVERKEQEKDDAMKAEELLKTISKID